MSDMEKLLSFWFGDAEPEKMATHRGAWWAKDPEFDQRINVEFKGLFDQAVAGKLGAWKETPLGCVALVILLDQFPRNIFRTDERAFSMDEAARALTRYVLDKQFDHALPMGAKLFLYLPLEHSENLSDQRECLGLMKEMGDAGYVDFAQKHLDVIEKFGRFPHRNVLLGRKSTPAEEAFLKGPNSSF